MSETKKFGDLLCELRRNSGRTIDDLALLMGCSSNDLFDIECGRQGPPALPDIQEIASRLRLGEEDELALIDAAIASEPFQTDHTCPRCGVKRQEFLGDMLPCPEHERGSHFLVPVVIPAGTWLSCSSEKRSTRIDVVLKRTTWWNGDRSYERRWRRA